MDKVLFIRNLDLIGVELAGIDVNRKPSTDCIHALRTAMLHLVTVMVAALDDGEGAPAEAGAPAEPSGPASAERTDPAAG